MININDADLVWNDLLEVVTTYALHWVERTDVAFGLKNSVWMYGHVLGPLVPRAGGVRLISFLH